MCPFCMQTHIHTEEENPAPIFPIPGKFSACVPSSMFQLLDHSWSGCMTNTQGEKGGNWDFGFELPCPDCIYEMILSSHLPSQTDAGREKEKWKKPNKIPDISAAKYIFWLLIQLYFSISCLMIHVSSGSLLKFCLGYE